MSYQNSQIEITIGTGAQMNVPQMVNYIKAGKAELAPLVDEAKAFALRAEAAYATLAPVATSGNYTDLINKPTIPAAQVNSDWNAVSGVAQILNKPTLATVATSGSYTDLTNKPDLSVYQTTTNLVTSVSSASTDAQYPSAKLFYDTVGDVETLLAAI